MKNMESDIIIDAPAQKVWNILMDFESHPEWNPFIRSISGEPKEGENITVRLKPPDGKEMTFRPVILKNEREKEFRWKGKLFIKGLFDGEHYFKLEKIDNSTTKFIHGENFSGILVGLLSGALKNTLAGFQDMNEALKARCEAA
ncbi:MAG: SRPBCC domain-containing protein [Saprospiraceae bacterium]|nr:SRPBCC domain-containing protein [Saprospiraceae bacterium]